MTDSISIEIHEGCCPAGLEIFQNETNFIVNLTASGGVGDLEVANGEKEVIALVQKHLSTISLLENTSRSEVLTVDTSDICEMPISSPPTEEVAAVTNVRVGLFQPNTLETVSRGQFTPSRAMDFRWELCDTSCNKNSEGTGGAGSGGDNSSNKESPRRASQPGGDNVTTQFNYKVVNHASVVVAEILLRRSSSHATVRLVEEQHLTPVQIAVIFAGLSFLVLAIKKQKSLVKLVILFVILVLLISIFVLTYVVTL